MLIFKSIFTAIKEVMILLVLVCYLQYVSSLVNVSQLISNSTLVCLFDIFTIQATIFGKFFRTTEKVATKVKVRFLAISSVLITIATREQRFVHLSMTSGCGWRRSFLIGTKKKKTQKNIWLGWCIHQSATDQILHHSGWRSWLTFKCDVFDISS